ncbi:MAG: VOC family protein [Methanomassiliicoccales archaeon]
MPLGDPMGGEYEYGEEGTVKGIWISAVPVSDLDQATEFFNQVLGLEILLDARENNWVELGVEGPSGNLGLYVPSPLDDRQPGGVTGIVFKSQSIYDVHKRLVDFDVVFTLKPERQEWGGLLASFKDPDGNEFTVMEDPEHYSRSIPRDAGYDIGSSCFLPGASRPEK